MKQTRRKIYGRLTHRAPKNWAIIDMRAFEHIVAEQRAKGMLSGHDGECLERLELERRVRVAMAFEAYSERQARLFAANGGKGQTLRRLTQVNGQRPARIYANEDRYAAVELAVLAYLRKQSKIDWNLQAVRQEMFESKGERVLWDLCTGFKPRACTAEEAIEKEQREEEDRQLQFGQLTKFGRPKTFKPTKKRAYLILDLADFRARCQEAHEQPVEPAPEDGPEIHEGRLFSLATRARIGAGNWKMALDQFRFREKADSLPFGRYLALPATICDVLIGLEKIPSASTREQFAKAALSALRDAKDKDQSPDALRRRWWKKGWWREREPGIDDEARYGQQSLVGLLSVRELLTIPLPDDSPCPFFPRRGPGRLVAAPPRRKAKKNPKKPPVESEQCPLKLPPPQIKPQPIRVLDTRKGKRAQYLLFSKG